MKLTEAIDKVTELRKQGLTYKQIGVQLKMTKQRVHQILVANKKKESAKHLWTHGLSVRNIRIIQQLKINGQAELKQGIENGDIQPFKYKNFGLKSYHDLCAWAGIPPIEFRNFKPCPHCGKLQ